MAKATTEARHLSRRVATLGRDLDRIWDRARALSTTVAPEGSSTREEALSAIGVLDEEIELYRELAGIASGIEETIDEIRRRRCEIEAALAIESEYIADHGLDVERRALGEYEVTGKLGGYTVELWRDKWEISGDVAGANGSYSSFEDALDAIVTSEIAEYGVELYRVDFPSEEAAE